MYGGRGQLSSENQEVVDQPKPVRTAENIKYREHNIVKAVIFEAVKLFQWNFQELVKIFFL